MTPVLNERLLGIPDIPFGIDEERFLARDPGVWRVVGQEVRDGNL
ncbi:hypothetical protein [Thermodesulfitimonas sp.]